MALTRQQIWELIREEARQFTIDEPMLGSFFHATLLNHKSLRSALSFQLASKLDSTTVQSIVLREIIEEACRADSDILDAAAADIAAVVERDPAVTQYSVPLLYLKGFHALQGYRVAHWLWMNNRRSLACYLQNQISVVFGVDVHPAAQIGRGIMFDHATGIVVGETSVIEDDVSVLQSVTLGGTGKEGGDRHPKIRRGVMIGAGAKILGNIEVGHDAKVGAGSVVLQPVPARATVAGVPAKIVGRTCDCPAMTMSQSI